MFSECTYEIIAGIMCVLNAERNTKPFTHESFLEFVISTVFKKSLCAEILVKHFY